jgi:hypothetical protein
LYEEGTCHEVWRHLVSGESLSDSLISRVLPVAHSVVLLEASEDVLAERLGSKQSPGPISRLLLSRPIDSSEWKTARSSYERIKSLLQANGARMVVITNENDVASAERELADIANACGV